MVTAFERLIMNTKLLMQITTRMLIQSVQKKTVAGSCTNCLQKDRAFTNIYMNVLFVLKDSVTTLSAD